MLELLRQSGAALSAPCGGTGHCAGCAVRLSGELSPAQDAEIAALGNRYSEGFRLACKVMLMGDARIYDTGNTIVFREATQTVQAGEEKTHATKPICLAVDLGTTTVALRLFTDDGVVLERAELNCQRSYGADVITRIDYCRRGGLEELHMVICRQLAAMLEVSLADIGSTVGDIDSAVVAGNPAMLHILAGIDPSPLGVSPYDTGERFGRVVRFVDVGGLPDMFFMPCVGGFTGGDLVAVLTALGDVPEGTAVCDFGTNGEIALRTADRWRVCSTAAGPALEGGGISCGTGAVHAAVSRISLLGKPKHDVSAADLRLELIGYARHDEKLKTFKLRSETQDCSQSPPNGAIAGLTGAALLDLVAILLECGVIDSSGRMTCGEWAIDDRFSLTQADIRQIQLAKGAIAAGLRCLTLESKIDKVFITGGLGCRMDPAAVLATGLVPRDVTERLEFLPALALEGAAMCCGISQRERAMDIAARCDELVLGGNTQFDMLFVESMEF